MNERSSADALPSLDASNLPDELTRGLRSHMEHAPAWRSGWVKWAEPAPWRMHACVAAGLLAAGDAEPGVLAVHITDAGRSWLGAADAAASGD